MPSVEENVGIWDGDYEWHDEGEEWSREWGNSTAQWYGCVYPRIQRFLPAGRILELAPGYGRWVDFLLPHCDSYIGVDLSTRCIDACNQRFAGIDKATFATNDGVTLAMVADSSVDFVFCFDSFVHVEDETLASYLKELDRVLAPDGVAFIHHSNMGTYRRLADLAAPLGLLRLPAKWRLRLDHVGIVSNTQWRGLSVTAARFADIGGIHRVALRRPGTDQLERGRLAHRRHLRRDPSGLSLGSTQPSSEEPAVRHGGAGNPTLRHGLRHVVTRLSGSIRDRGRGSLHNCPIHQLDPGTAGCRLLRGRAGCGASASTLSVAATEERRAPKS